MSKTTDTPKGSRKQKAIDPEMEAILAAIRKIVEDDPPQPARPSNVIPFRRPEPRR